MKNTSSIPTRITAAGSLALLLSAFLPVAYAADLTWINTSATANWNTSSLFWNDGSSDVAWTDNNAALFVSNGVFRTITLSQNVQVTELRGDGTITGGTVKLTGVSSTLDVPLINTTAGQNFDVDVAITGSHGLTKTGEGRITLYKASDYTGATELNATNVPTSKFAEIYIKFNNALPSSTSFNIIGGTAKSRLILNGTTNGSAGVSQEFSAVTGDGRITARTGQNTLTINTVNGATSTFSGSLNEFNVTAGQSLSLAIKGAGTQILTGTTNTYVGSTTISGGALKLGAGSHLSGTSSVTVSGGTLTSTSGNINLGVGAVSMSAGAITPAGAGTAGTFTLAASQAFTTTGGTLNFDLLSSSSFDQIIGSGSGTFSLTDTTLALGGLTSVAGTYQLFSGFASGSVSGLTITGLTPAYSGVLGTDGILTVSLAAIPEPSTYAMLAGLSILGFATLRRRSPRA